MSNKVLKLPLSKINEMKEFYKEQIHDKQPTSSLFVAKPQNCTITAYKSGKVLFQGQNAETEANKWGKVTTTETNQKKSSKQTHNYLPPHNVANLSFIGSDEVGTGDFFGPMTVVAAYVSTEKMELLKELGVQDSKSLTDKKITQIAKDIIHTIPYSLLTLHNDKYNQLQAKGMTQGKIKSLLHNKAILNVKEKLDSTDKLDGTLIDQFCQPNVFFSHIKGEKEQISDHIYFQTKGESVHLSVAAASIIARYAFLKRMEQLSKKVGVELPKGAGAKVDEVAANIIFSHGQDQLKNISKYHFANTKKALEIAYKKSK